MFVVSSSEGVFALVIVIVAITPVWPIVTDGAMLTDVVPTIAAEAPDGASTQRRGRPRPRGLCALPLA